MERPRVVIAEDYVLIQEMIRDLLETEFDVVAAVEDGSAALNAVEEHRPDILLVDASLPVLSGFALTERVALAYPETSIIFVTAHSDPAYVDRAFELGAKAYLLKGSLHIELLPAIREVLAHRTYKSAVLA